MFRIHTLSLAAELVTLHFLRKYKLTRIQKQTVLGQGTGQLCKGVADTLEVDGFLSCAVPVQHQFGYMRLIEATSEGVTLLMHGRLHKAGCGKYQQVGVKAQI